MGGATAEYIDAFGSYSWGYWSCDSHDCHYYFGYVRDSTPSDMNWSGVMVGRSTLWGSGSDPIGAVFHAYLYDGSGGPVDLFPGEAGQTTAACINNRGEIAGFILGQGSYRRSWDGTLTMLAPVMGHSVSPSRINGEGVIIGSHYPSRAFASPGGAVTVDLPDLGSFETVSALDLNDSAWIVGMCGQFNDPETYAILWEPGSGGEWTAWDLVEQLDTPGVLLESAIAIDNAGHIIARGHLDGTDDFSSRTYFLVPDAPLAGWCAPDIGQHPSDTTVGGTTASFGIVVVNAGDVLSYQWRLNGLPIDTASNPSAATATLELVGLTAADSGGMYDCVVTSACGETLSNPAVLTVDPACAADLAEPFGVLNIFDIQAFIGLYNAQDAAADLAAPFGTLNIFDLQAYIGLYNQGCP